MSLFYDPQKKKPQDWIKVVFVVIPIILLIIGWIVGKSHVQSKKATEPPEVDIFDKF